MSKTIYIYIYTPSLLYIYIYKQQSSGVSHCLLNRDQLATSLTIHDSRAHACVVFQSRQVSSYKLHPFTVDHRQSFLSWNTKHMCSTQGSVQQDYSAAWKKDVEVEEEEEGGRLRRRGLRRRRMWSVENERLKSRFTSNNISDNLRPRRERIYS